MSGTVAATRRAPANACNPFKTKDRSNTRFRGTRLELARVLAGKTRNYCCPDPGRNYQNNSPDKKVGAGDAAAREGTLMDGSVNIYSGFHNRRSYRCPVDYSGYPWGVRDRPRPSRLLCLSRRQRRRATWSRVYREGRGLSPEQFTFADIGSIKAMGFFYLMLGLVWLGISVFAR